MDEKKKEFEKKVEEEKEKVEAVSRKKFEGERCVFSFIVSSNS